MTLIMDSSPRPIRRFSRWKTTKHTFVLGGKTFTTGKKDHKANDWKNGQKNADKRTKTRSSPRSPHSKRSSFRSSSRSPYSKRLSSHLNLQSEELSLVETQKNFNGTKAVIDCLQDSSLDSNNEKVLSKDISTSAHALSVLCPNLSTTTKDIPEDTIPDQPGNVEENNSRSSRSESVVQTNVVVQTKVSGAEDSNTDSANMDKENSTSAILVPTDGSVSCESHLAGASVDSNANQQNDVDESSTRVDSRRHSLRDRSRLASSAVLMQKNYPFFTKSEKKNTKMKNGNKKAVLPKKVSSISLNASMHRESKCKISVVRGTRASSKYHKRTKKSDRDKDNISVSDEKSATMPHAEQDISLAIPDMQDEMNSISSVNENRSFKHSKQKASVSVRLLRTSKGKARNRGTAEGINLTESGNSNTEIQMEKDRSLNSEKSSAQAYEDSQIGHKSPVQLSSAVKNDDSVSYNPSARRHLRDRSSLATPAVQYPARYMSTAQIRSLSDKARRLLSLTRNVYEANTHTKKPQKQRSGAEKNSKSAVSIDASEKTSTKGESQETRSKKDRAKTERNSQTSRRTANSNKYSNQITHVTTKKGAEKFLPHKEKSSMKSSQQDQSSLLHDTLFPSVSPGSELQKGLNHKTTNHVKTSKGPASPSELWGILHEEDVLCDKKRGVKKDSKMKKTQRKKCTRPTNTDSNQRLSTLSNESLEQMEDPSPRMEQGDQECMRKSRQREIPSSSQTGDIILNDTAFGLKSRKKMKRRRLFQDSVVSEAKKSKFGWDLYENGRDILLWSENGEARKGPSATSLDVIFNDIIDLEDHLKNSETEHIHQRLIGKVMGRVKRSLKSKIHEIEKVKGLESDIRKGRDKCNKIKAEITKLRDKDKRLQREMLARKELKQKALQEWMRNLKSLVVSARGQKQ